MARRNVFANLGGNEGTPVERKATPGYASRGASRSMINSLGELAEKAARAEQLLQGETVVELDPAEIDDSFVSDRMDGDETAFLELVDAIRDRGQDSPVLVRPHPEAPGRYQVVFGHRRVRAARILDKKVRAVVKSIADLEHVVAQGQENAARENLSFIERAFFAKQLIELGYERATIQSALAVDAPMLTRMLSVSGRIPDGITRGIGAAKGVGRDRWLELAQLIEQPGNLAKAQSLADGAAFAEVPSEERFEIILKAMTPPRKRPKRTSESTRWETTDGAVAAEYRNTGKGFALSLSARDAGKFGKFLSDNLDRFYAQFRLEENRQGD